MASHRILMPVLLWLALGQVALGQNSITFSFTVPGSLDTTTSAAVLDPNGVMVKQLWANVSYPPGTYTASWDGSYDVNATSTPGSSYTIKLLMDNVTYTYDGHFGTADLDWYGTHKYSQVCGWTQGLPKIVFAGNRGWVACTYNEVANNIMVFDKNTPNYPSQANESYRAAQGRVPHETDDIATDNQWVYMLEHATDTRNVATYPQNYVTAVDANSGMPVFFSQGTVDNAFVWFNPPLYSSYIDFYLNLSPATTTNYASGIAVQRSGNILAVAHGRQNYIALFDKRTGASLGTVTGVVGLATTQFYNTPMQFTSEGLWYVGGDHNLYLITGLPSSPVITQPITGFQYVAAIGANTKTNVLYVADGGTNQQIYGYAPSTHAKVRTYGTLGGYHDCNPSITHDRLELDDTVTLGSNSISNFYHYVFVQADDDDHLWIGDLEGRRIQHIDASNNYVEQILYKRPSYNVTVSETMPTRVFIGWLEFAVDYSKTNVPGDGDPAVGGSGAWTLSKNWKVCAWGAHGSTPVTPDADMYYLIAVERLSNGKVYAAPQYHSVAPLTWFQLPEDGTPARNTGVAFTGTSVVTRTGDMNKYSWTQTAVVKTGTASAGSTSLTVNTATSLVVGYNVSGTGIAGGSTVSAIVGTTVTLSLPTTAAINSGSITFFDSVRTVNITKQALTGFDTNSNPIFTAATTIASTVTNSSNVLLVPAGAGLGGIYYGTDVTTGGYYPVIQANPVSVNRYPHAAAIKPGAGFASYAWHTLPETNQITSDLRGNFPSSTTSGAGSTSAFQAARTEGTNIIFGYGGNYSPFGAQFYHYYEDGMMIGQFGNNQGFPALGSNQLVRPGNFGNADGFTTTTYNGDIYLYVGDEAFAPAHRWHVSNLSSVHEYSGTTTLQPNAAVSLTKLF